tara:strand:- start:69 stop:1412 length:1344 start_codon:yes stop_codon:yes gene_type:complete
LKQNKNNLDLSKNTIAVYGLGNVGGPIAAAWLRKRANIIGVDISLELLDSIKNGTSHRKEPFISKIFSNHLKNNSLSLSSDGIQASKNSNIKIISVPVDIKKNKIDLNAIISVSKNISKGLKKGDAVVVCPSLPPGTTKNVVLPILEKQSNLKGEKDFFLIYNPERIFEGRALEDIEENYPAIVGGLGKKSLEFGTSLLKIISKKGVLQMSSLENAEAEKLFEGVYRDVNIALANELADYCKNIGVDYWEARKGANSQPYCKLHYPGTGVGGLCIPIYPQFILESAKKYEKSMKIITSSRKTNDQMPKKCVMDAIELLLKNKRNKKGAKIAVLGLGFRGEVTDSRLSPTYTVVNEFLKMGFSVSVHDPYIFEDKILSKRVKLTSDIKNVVDKADLIFVSTDHKIYSKLSSINFKNAKMPLLIFDGRNILNKNNFKNNFLSTVGIKNP